MKLKTFAGYLILGAVVASSPRCVKGEGILDGHTLTPVYTDSPIEVDSRVRRLAQYRGNYGAHHVHKALLEWHSLTNMAYIVESSAVHTNDWRAYTAVISKNGRRERLVIPAETDRRWRVSLAPTYEVPVALMELYLHVEPTLSQPNLQTCGTYWQFSDGTTCGIGGWKGMQMWGLYSQPQPLLFRAIVTAADGSSLTTFGAYNIVK